MDEFSSRLFLGFQVLPDLLRRGCGGSVGDYNMMYSSTLGAPEDDWYA